MKKLLLFLLLAVTSVTTYAKKEVQETATQKTKEVLSTVGNKAGEIIDSGKVAIKNGAVAVQTGAHYLDTSSTVKEMYHDFRNGITALAEALKVAVEPVYKVLVMQQIVHSVMYLLIVCILCFVPLIWFKKVRLWADERNGQQEGVWLLWVISSVLPMIAGVILFFATATTILTGFINPEYGAMQDIVKMAQQVRNNPTQCQSCQQ